MKHELTKEEVFESIYRSYEKDVYRTCLHLTMDEDLACEITQQAFVNFYERFDKMDVKCTKAYLIGMARNLAYSYYRKKNREWNPPADEDGMHREVEPVTDSVEEQYFEDMRKTMEKELSNEILMDLKEGHEAWYEIINRIFFMEMSHDEVAKELGITKDVLYSRLHRAKLWIRKNYSEEFNKIAREA